MVKGSVSLCRMKEATTCSSINRKSKWRDSVLLRKDREWSLIWKKARRGFQPNRSNRSKSIFAGRCGINRPPGSHHPFDSLAEVHALRLVVSEPIVRLSNRPNGRLAASPGHYRPVSIVAIARTPRQPPHPQQLPESPRNRSCRPFLPLRPKGVIEATIPWNRGGLLKS